MTQTAPVQPAAAPRPAAKRIVAIDNLRGFALLGILVMNIMSFSMPGNAYSNPESYYGDGWANQLTYAITHIMADQKFMGLFSMLFGASVILFTNSLIAKGKKPTWAFYIRNIWLLIFGMLHFALLWFGDILMLYAVCSFILFFFRKMAPRWQFTLGLVLFLIPIGVNIATYAYSLELNSAEQAILDGYWDPPQAEIVSELAIFKGAYSDQIDYRLELSEEYSDTEDTTGDIAYTLIDISGAADFSARAFGMMLMGMALYTWGVLTGKLDAAVYRRMVQIGFGLGIPIATVGWLLNSYNGWDWSYSLFLGQIPNQIATPLIDAGYIGLIMLWSKSNRWPQLRARLAAIGRTALSSYISHSIIATTIFYGFGFGLFGEVNRPMQVVIVVLIWLSQLIIAPWWLDRFRYGPLEWIWRCLTYFKIQPMRR